ncbi:MAG: hypothetical protein IJ516_06565 [Phascolarctobacterium sp.]|nr:hypothetical protein [Phascolarctobacterium sp.]
MKKVLRYLLMTVMALCISLPCLSAEAASIALLPLINNVEGGDEIANQVFYKEAINAIKFKKGFVLVENDKLNAAIDAAHIGDEVPDKLTLAKIAKEGGVDIVFAMQIDDLEDKPVFPSTERMLELDMEGVAVAYNSINGAYYKHEFGSDKQIDETLTSRWDWVHEEFGRQVRREIDRALRAKK